MVLCRKLKKSPGLKLKKQSNTATIFYLVDDLIMDDLDRLIEQENQRNPVFRDEVNTRSNEIEISLKLRAAREALRLTQKDVAKKYNISLQAISRIENPRDNHVSLYMLNWYANILGFDLKVELINR